MKVEVNGKTYVQSPDGYDSLRYASEVGRVKEALATLLGDLYKQGVMGDGPHVPIIVVEALTHTLKGLLNSVPAGYKPMCADFVDTYLAYERPEVVQ